MAFVASIFWHDQDNIVAGALDPFDDDATYKQLSLSQRVILADARDHVGEVVVRDGREVHYYCARFSEIAKTSFVDLDEYMMIP